MPDSVAARCRPGCDGSAPTVREAIEVAAVIGAKVEPAIARSVADIGPPELDECVANGFLLWEGQVLVFRHELARRAALDSIPRDDARSCMRMY